jgi:possible calcium-transporting ATPase
LSQVVQAFNMRSDKSLFKVGFFTNSALNKAAALSLAMIVVVVFTPLSGFFSLMPLTANLYAIAIGLIVAPLVIIELSKAMRR